MDGGNVIQLLELNDFTYIFIFLWQLHDNQLGSLPGALGELQELQQLRLRYTHIYTVQTKHLR